MEPSEPSTKDKDKVQLYADCNWTPASVYWHRKFKEKEDALKEIQKNFWSLMNLIRDEDFIVSLNPERPELKCVCYREPGHQVTLKSMDELEKKIEKALK